PQENPRPLTEQTAFVAHPGQAERPGRVPADLSGSVMVLGAAGAEVIVVKRLERTEAGPQRGVEYEVVVPLNVDDVGSNSLEDLKNRGGADRAVTRGRELIEVRDVKTLVSTRHAFPTNRSVRVDDDDAVTRFRQGGVKPQQIRA